MDFAILGTIEATSDGRPVDLGPPKQRAVLAALLLHANEIVATDRLVGFLWGDDPPRTAAHSIQIYVSDLRKRFDEAGTSAVITTRTPGYVLHAEPDAVDAARFERLVVDGGRAVRTGDVRAGAEALRDALRMWRGPPLAELRYADFTQPHIRHLEELHAQAVEAFADAGLRLDDAQAALTGLSSLVEEQPFRERARELQLLALYRCGRQADALRTYETFRHQLREELGLDPSPALRQLQGRILLQDTTLFGAPAALGGADPSRNPFKGLRPFTEDDRADFFGRQDLVEQLCEALASGGPLVTVVGPSGSGKSSVVAAGLIPALRDGAVAGSSAWRIVSIVPGDDPEAELAAALSGPTTDTLLWIDQFEELFNLGEDAAADLLRDLVAALVDEDRRVRAVVTIRADFYDRPLLHSGFAELFSARVVSVLPLTVTQLGAAITEPTRRTGVEIEPALVAELISDAAGRPGALPLFQYVLTELFEHRQDQTVTLGSYHDLGGLQGALSRRAEDLYGRFSPSEQVLAEQVLLRLVTPGDGSRDVRRRTRASELTGLDLDPVELAGVLDRFGHHRLVTFDRDAASGEATVEVAHEALLEAWDRLRGWIDQHRGDLRQLEHLTAAVDEWIASGRDAGYLLAGGRLDHYRAWSERTTLVLTAQAHAYLEASRDQHQVVIVADPSEVSAIHRLLKSGADRATAELGIRVEHIATVSDTTLERVADEGVPLLVVVRNRVAKRDHAREHPETHFVVLDSVYDPHPNVTYARFAEHEGSFLVGAAAALTSATGRIGFIGAIVDLPILWRFQAGFEAGARHVAPDIEIDSVYLTGHPDSSGFESPTLAAHAATALYRGGADVVYHAAGHAGLGLFETAVAESGRQARHLWAIGVDADEYRNEHVYGGTKLWDYGPDDWKPHLLTSMLKRFDRAVHDSIVDFRAGRLEAGLRTFDLANGGVDYATSGGFIDHLVPQLENLKADIVAGRIEVPTVPDEPPRLAR
ncbi:BTAD domain-containing putative transcriptional regulator [Nitriliruptor alkaliphilus]|uniref:nSTAND1 domain-containing NTPase n=1 Tax=Nitriliruptor alkaliphilus TaxID=427918 RepID=UPI0014703758|nr:BTAD domain-containing putative transcriptional regulator [Nitriliruptor alkaliphilus]